MGMLLTSQSSILKAQNFDTPRQDDDLDQGVSTLHGAVFVNSTQL